MPRRIWLVDDGKLVNRLPFRADISGASTNPASIVAPSTVNGVSEGLFDRGLCLPSSSSLTPDQQSRVIDVVKGLAKS